MIPPPVFGPKGRVQSVAMRVRLRRTGQVVGMKRLSRRGKLFVISSPSGGGKTTVVRELLRRLPGLVRSVSATTRTSRASERHGAHYRFVSRRAFQRLRARGALLEWAKVHAAYYGTPKGPVDRALARGRDVIFSIDVQGARQIRRRFGRQAVLVFLVPPSMSVLKQRLTRRSTEAAEVIRRRLAVARRELACVRWYDYAVVNQQLSRAIDQVKAIVVAERLRVNSPPLVRLREVKPNEAVGAH